MLLLLLLARAAAAQPAAAPQAAPAPPPPPQPQPPDIVFAASPDEFRDAVLANREHIVLTQHMNFSRFDGAITIGAPTLSIQVRPRSHPPLCPMRPRAIQPDCHGSWRL